ncbi:lanthionine synthetase LanC family protein, partial [Actinophytocola sp.]|uniref:lanthionine synthetase LanC family protein n=1 Tax=Actinophytocola sp. TaxID=1872138 RepID=UPI003D6C45A1
RRRRALAAVVAGQVVDAAITGPDGTVTWVAPVLDHDGWSARPLSGDLYGGTAGVAVLAAGYLREQAAGRADEVPGLDRVLRSAMRTMRLAERATGGPPLAGGYLGLGSRIWAWLLLRRLGAVGDDALEWATALAGQVSRAAAEHPAHDVLAGRAGAIVPLLRLAEHTRDRRWAELAGELGDALVAAATPAAAESEVDTVCWPTDRFPEGVGGFAHGATGIGWALARLADVTGEQAHADTAAAAFAYERTLYDPERGGWRDLREEGRVGGAWCHGGAGIGVAAVDLLGLGGPYADDWRETVRVAAASSWEQGVGWNHTLCHGDLGVWEIVTEAIARDLGPGGLDRSTVDAHVVGAVEEFGVVTGLARDVFVPGLLPGAAGVAYQLLRLHPECRLPSVLRPDPGPAK